MKNISKHIAQTLKSLRQQCGWSLDKAAKETGVSKAMLGQIEREESSPTIATLWKIANGFNIPFSFLLEDNQLNFQKISKHAFSNNLNPKDKKIRITPLFPFDKQLHCEIFGIELLPHCEHLSSAHQPGVIEHVIVVEGTIEILVDGVWQRLNKGEGLKFKANQSHGYRNVTAEAAYIHNIIHYPKNTPRRHKKTVKE